MKKIKSATQEVKPNKMGFKSSVSIYKEKFSEGKEITFKPNFSITKTITFSSQKKIANNLARTFGRFIPLKF